MKIRNFGLLVFFYLEDGATETESKYDRDSRPHTPRLPLKVTFPMQQKPTQKPTPAWEIKIIVHPPISHTPICQQNPICQHFFQ